MERDEQMWEAVEQVHGNLSRREAFVTLTALEWADKTMIDKACAWLKFNTNWGDEWDDMGRNLNYGMIEEFRKAMEE